MTSEFTPEIGMSSINPFDPTKFYPPNVEGTTWLKPVPWNGIDKDEKKEIEKEIEILKTAPYYNPEHPEGVSFMFDCLKITGVNEGETSFEASPVLQIISINICNKLPTWKEFKIYGDISIRDGRNNTFYMYDRKIHNAQTVSHSANSLSLIPCHFAPLTWGNVKFHLTKDNGDLIFDEEAIVEYTINNGIECKTIGGTNGYYALMFYTIIPYASIAKVEMHIKDSDPYTGTDEIFRVYGKVKARSSKVDGKLKDIELICFDTDSSEPVEMRHGQENSIQMSTPLFAVSVMSPFDFYLSLFCNNGTPLVVDETSEIDPGYRARAISKNTYVCTNEDFYLSLSIEWFSPRVFFLNRDMSKYRRVEWSTTNQATDFPFMVERISKKRRYCQFLPVAKINNPPAVCNGLVEVFSVLVENGDYDSSSPLDLTGSIVLRHAGETLYIFSRSKEFPDKLLSNEQGLRRCVSLAWSDKSWVEEKDFFIHLKLKDDKDKEVCRGYRSWYLLYDYKRYNTRLCEVILGKDGYFAALHYSVFSNGLRAKLTVQCCSLFANVYYENYCTRVHGSVVAEYGNFDYSSTYDKEYYRSIIFRRSVEDGIYVESGSELPLSKSRVCAPSNCEELIVDIDLYVEVHYLGPTSAPVKSSQGDGHVKFRIPFKTKSNTVREIHSGDCCDFMRWCCEGCCVRVGVEWF